MSVTHAMSTEDMEDKTLSVEDLLPIHKHFPTLAHTQHTDTALIHTLPQSRALAEPAGHWPLWPRAGRGRRRPLSGRSQPPRGLPVWGRRLGGAAVGTESEAGWLWWWSRPEWRHQNLQQRHGEHAPVTIRGLWCNCDDYVFRGRCGIYHLKYHNFGYFGSMRVTGPRWNKCRNWKFKLWEWSLVSVLFLHELIHSCKKNAQHSHIWNFPFSSCTGVTRNYGMRIKQ